MTATTYAQLASNAHRSGGETQTEATAKMTGLGRKSVGFLTSILNTLEQEARACTTEAQYGPVRVQQLRVREALIARGAL